MLKVETTKQQTINPKDLTDKHFIGVFTNDNRKGMLIKISENAYTLVILSAISNTYDSKLQNKSIAEVIETSEHKNFFATLDYEEFKNWYFSK